VSDAGDGAGALVDIRALIATGKKWSSDRQDSDGPPRFAMRDGIAVGRHNSCSPCIRRHQMSDEKRITETETKTKHDLLGNPKEQKTTIKEKDVDSSGNKSETKTEYKEKK
jgi:hypothetical protein